MGTKYIVELEDGEHLYKTTINALGNPVMRSAEKVPYYEPDLEQVKKEAYEQGYRAGYVKYLNKSYEDGLNDAWGAARKTADMYSEERRKIFGENFIQKIYGIYSAAEVIEKLQAYEQAQPTKLRDRLTAFCMKHHCANCPLNTDDFSCGKGLSFKPCYEEDKDIIPNDELEIYAAAAGLASQK